MSYNIIPYPFATSTSSGQIPEGYVMVSGPDTDNFLIPEFMVPALHQIFDGYRKKADLDAFKRAGSVSYIIIQELSFRWLSSSYGPEHVTMLGPMIFQLLNGPMSGPMIFQLLNGPMSAPCRPR
jgi:hypothetical protein